MMAGVKRDKDEGREMASQEQEQRATGGVPP